MQPVVSVNLFKRYSENSNLNLKFCVVICNAILKSYAQNKENTFFTFYFIFFFLNLTLTWNFVRHFAILLRSLMQKMKKKTIHEIFSYANFSYKCAPKHMGRIDPIRFERVNPHLLVTIKFWCNNAEKCCKYSVSKQATKNLFLAVCCRPTLTRVARAQLDVNWLCN